MADPINHCPVCGFGPFPEAYALTAEIRQSFDICSCCGCEYGYDDDERHFTQWVAAGCKWFVPKARPQDWTLDAQVHNRVRPWPPADA